MGYQKSIKINRIFVSWFQCFKRESMYCLFIQTVSEYQNSFCWLKKCLRVGCRDPTQHKVKSLLGGKYRSAKYEAILAKTIFSAHFVLFWVIFFSIGSKKDLWQILNSGNQNNFFLHFQRKK